MTLKIILDHRATLTNQCRSQPRQRLTDSSLGIQSWGRVAVLFVIQKGLIIKAAMLVSLQIMLTIMGQHRSLQELERAYTIFPIFPVCVYCNHVS